MYTSVSCCNYNYEIQGMLYQIWSYQCEGITPEWQSSYNVLCDKFIKKLSSDVNIAISFFDILNLNNEADAFAIRFVDKITSNFKTKEEKEKFTLFIDKLSKKYPNSPYVDWDVFRFYSAMHAMDELDTDGEDNYD